MTPPSLPSAEELWEALPGLGHDESIQLLKGYRDEWLEAAAEVADQYCCEPCRDKPEFAAAARTEIAAEIRKLKEKP